MDVNLTTFDNVEKGWKESASFKVKNMENTLELSIIDALVGGIVTSEEEIPLGKSITENFPYMNDVVINEIDDKSVGILLGSRFIRHYFGKQVRLGKNDEPIALLTDFGWVVVGPMPDNESYNPEISQIGVTKDEIENLDKMIRRMYRHDFLSRPDEEFPSEYCHNSQYDDYAVEQMKESVTFDKKLGRYSCGLSWKYGREKTKEMFSKINTWSYCVNRTERLKIKLQKNPALRAGAFEQVRANIANGYTKVITDLTAHPESPVCYLASHIALHDDKPGKFRVCQDAAGKIDGVSLNSCLLTGPDNLNSLVGIILRFRRRRVVLSADIKDFFYRILMDVKDRAACRFMWWEDETMTTTQIIEGLCHLFGLASSPGIANTLLARHASEIRERFGLAVFIAIMIQMYVDDYLDSLDTVEQAKEMKSKLTEAMALGGFQLTKWKSNFSELNDPSPTIPTQNTEPEVDATTAAEKGDRWRGSDLKEANNSPSQPTPEEPENDDPPTPEEIKAAYETDQGDINEFVKETGSKVLGVGYDFDTDMMYVRVREKQFKTVTTKSQLLSWIASIYDPLGYIAPYSLKGRQFLQQISDGDIGWKDKVPDEILGPFTKWKNKINHLKNLKIPRWTSKLGMEDSIAKLVIFCDASILGYGIVVYIRRCLKGDNPKVHLAFLMSKSHVVPKSMVKDPIKGQECHGDSIPRLELVAAKLAAVWRDILVRESDEIFEQIYMFSDSLTVIKWIRNWNKKMKTFENFRLKKIRVLSNMSEWMYVPTDQNPADISSKGLEADDKKKWTYFHNGPSFLLLPENEWPKEPTDQPSAKPVEPRAISSMRTATIATTATVTPMELAVIGATKDEPETEFTGKMVPWPIQATMKLSTWIAKVRRLGVITKTLLSLKENACSDKPKISFNAKNITKNDVPTGHRYELRSKKNITETHRKPQNDTERVTQKPTETQNKAQNKIYLNLEEKNKAERLLIRAIQSQYFEKEITTLLKLGVFEPNSYEELKSRESKLIALSPFIDEDGILRVGGRLGKSKTLPYESKHPIILPKSDSEIIQSLIRHIHTQNLHCSQVETFYITRQKYYLLGGRNTVRNVVSKCIECQKASKKPQPQKMGELPEERVTIAAPFATSGIDVFGDFSVTHAGRGNKKRWVLIVTCFSTRAVALYPLPDMTLSSIIHALVKMSNQFPSLRKIVSDNGSNFRGANREIKEAMELWNAQEANDKLAEYSIEWEFGPASCGSWGGMWERLIGIIKNSFKACMKRKVLNTDSFDALCAGVAGVVNRRPLTRLNNSLDDMSVLSPAHFIYPYNFVHASTSVLPPIPDRGDVLRSTWTILQETLDVFWTQWERSYLTTLAERGKWTTATPPLKENDIVLIKEPITAREKWKTARIIEIIGDDQKHARRYKVKDAAGNIMERHCTWLIHLELY